MRQIKSGIIIIICHQMPEGIPVKQQAFLFTSNATFKVN